MRYIPLNVDDINCYVFVDASFANNKDLSSQLGFIVVLGTEEDNDNDIASFTLTGNIVHWVSRKCKRVTRSVLASEIYGMSEGVDIGFSIAGTINQILQQLNLPPVPMVVCTDSKSLYDAVTRLGTTVEKRLMIDIMQFREMYERREISEIRWIAGSSNPADAMTKTTANSSLTTLINDNEVIIDVQGWVKRRKKEKKENST